MKKLYKEHSTYIIVLTLAEIIFSIIAMLSFVYEDELETIAILANITKLIETIYSQTWWGLVIFSICLSSLFSLTSIIYKKLDYYFISIGIWIILAILAINLNHSIGNTMTALILFIPIIIMKIICYFNEKNKIKKK